MQIKRPDHWPISLLFTLASLKFYFKGIAVFTNDFLNDHS